MNTNDKIELLFDYCEKLQGKMLTMLNDLQKIDPNRAKSYEDEFDDLLSYGNEMRDRINQKPRSYTSE